MSHQKSVKQKIKCGKNRFFPPVSCFYFLLFTFCFLLSPILAQYSFDSFTTDNGLPQNGVRGIVQTPDGYLWFTTFDGLVRFDGVKFTVFDKNNSPGIASNRFSICTSSRTAVFLPERKKAA